MLFTGMSGRFPSTFVHEAPESLVKKICPSPSHPDAPGQEKPEYATKAVCEFSGSTAIAVTKRSGCRLASLILFALTGFERDPETCQIRPSEVPTYSVLESDGDTVMVVTKFLLLSVVRSEVIAVQFPPAFVV